MSEKLHNAAFDLLDVLEAVLSDVDGGGFAVRPENAEPLLAAVRRLHSELGEPAQQAGELQRFADELEEGTEGKAPADVHCLSVDWARRCIAAMRGVEQLTCVHPWEKVGINADGNPFCCECMENLIKDRPWRASNNQSASPK